MTAADIPAALRWDVSHAKRTLRGKPLPILQDALRMESQRYRPRKRLLKWLQNEIIGEDQVHILGEFKVWHRRRNKAKVSLITFLTTRYPKNRSFLP